MDARLVDMFINQISRVEVKRSSSSFRYIHFHLRPKFFIDLTNVPSDPSDLDVPPINHHMAKDISIPHISPTQETTRDPR